MRAAETMGADRPWSRARWLLTLAGVVALGTHVGGAVAMAADPSPGPQRSPGGSPGGTAATSAVPWPTGDELRRDLQDIGFSFRVDRVAGEWSGWAPTFALDRPPSLRLGVDGRGPAWAAFEVDLFALEARAVDVDATLTALLEVLARLPIPDADAARLFEYITADLLTSAPEQLETCALTRLPEGLMVIRVDADSGLASLLIARSVEARDAEADTAGCVPIRPTSLGPAPGALVSERLSVTATDVAGSVFGPAESTVEGSIVTVVLTFRNEAATEHTLTFEEPVAVDSGPVAPGEQRLLVVRRLEPGDYPFFSATDPEVMRGLLRVVAPPEPGETGAP